MQITELEAQSAQPGYQRLAVEGEMSIYTAGNLKETLSKVLATATQGIELDLSKVSEFDSAAVQVLLLTKREAAPLDKGVSIVAANPTVKEVLALYRINEQFQTNTATAA